MGMMNRLKAGWKALSTIDKVKIGLKLICSIGGGCIAGDIAGRSSIGRGRFEQACLCITSVGLGGYIGEKSAENLGETIDSIIELNEIRKQEQKEAQANG